ncbi:cytochrome b561 [Litorivivens lipolytica]|uniref:Cytochrome b561 n=1 Tax=Litorivivens lipolytica TaxID=1524264 RepID=A0A7W4Z7I1_9GAMM|nr:cytochrome b/b6 domain-containing protein [Litorivivens lipolytica]MBB3048050.1 cytochrome b561 [Litorivivens lipolytica]
MTYRYNAIAITLHWVIALCLISNLGLGWWMGDALQNEATQSLATDAFQWHKSLGLLILFLSLLRLCWRLLHPAPPLPESSPSWEHRVAALTHGLFYLLMIAIPLSGWLYVSAQWRGGNALNVPTIWFGLFEVPHLFGLNTLPAETRQTLAGWLMPTHETLSWAFTVLLALHIGAALRHHALLKDDVLLRMFPALTKGDTKVFAGKGHPTKALLVVVAASVLLVVGLTGHDASPVKPLPDDEGSALAERLAALSQPLDTDLPKWNIIPEESHIQFSGTHAGQPFKGRFTRWQADLRFDESTGVGTVAVVIDTGAATDGVPMHDRTLPQAEWFNVAAYPFATYLADSFEKSELGHSIQGTLTIKQHPLSMAPLSLEIVDNMIHIRGELTLDRADVDMGMESDPAGEWVSRDILIHISVWARSSTKKPEPPTSEVEPAR